MEWEWWISTASASRTCGDWNSIWTWSWTITSQVGTHGRTYCGYVIIMKKARYTKRKDRQRSISCICFDRAGSMGSWDALLKEKMLTFFRSVYLFLRWKYSASQLLIACVISRFHFWHSCSHCSSVSVSQNWHCWVLPVLLSYLILTWYRYGPMICGNAAFQIALQARGVSK